MLTAFCAAISPLGAFYLGVAEIIRCTVGFLPIISEGGTVQIFASNPKCVRADLRSTFDENASVKIDLSKYY